MCFIPPKVNMMFTRGQMVQCLPEKVIRAALLILRQNILDTQKIVSYTAVNKKSSYSISHSR